MAFPECDYCVRRFLSLCAKWSAMKVWPRSVRFRLKRETGRCGWSNTTKTCLCQSLETLGLEANSHSYYTSTARPQASVFSARLGIIRCSPEARMITCCVRSLSIERNQTIAFFHVLARWTEMSGMLNWRQYWRVFYKLKILAFIYSFSKIIFVLDLK